eukprot:357640-Chlamydomonas_euryale.AAC.4
MAISGASIHGCDAASCWVIAALGVLSPMINENSDDVEMTGPASCTRGSIGWMFLSTLAIPAHGTETLSIDAAAAACSLLKKTYGTCLARATCLEHMCGMSGMEMP